MIGKGVSFTVVIWTLICVGVLECVDELAYGQSELACKLPPVKEGEAATLTCKFKTNISTIGSVSVKAYGLQFEDSGTTGDVHLVLLLNPNGEPQTPHSLSPHFLFGNVSKNPDGIHWNVYIRIPNATQAFEGDYQCREVGPSTPSSPRCPFILDLIKTHILNATTVLLYVDLKGFSEDRRNKYVFRRIVGKLQGAEQVTKDFPAETAQTNFTLTGLKNNTEYEVSVYQGPQKIEVIHKICIPAISNLSVSYTNDSSVLLQWSSSVCDHSFINYFYEVCYKVSSKGSQEDTCFNNSAMSSANIRDPERGTKYDIYVKVHVDGTNIGEVSLLDTLLMKTAPPPSETPDDDEVSIGVGWVILIVIAAIVVTAVVVIIFFTYGLKRCRKDKGKDQQDIILKVEDDTKRGDSIQGNPEDSLEAGTADETCVEEEKALLAKPEDLDDPPTDNFSRGSSKQTVPVNVQDKDVVPRSNRANAGSGAPRFNPQSTGTSNASLTSGQVSADVHDTRAEGDNLNSPPVTNNAPKTAGQFPVDAHGKDVVQRPNGATTRGASGEPPQSTPGTSTAPLTSGQGNHEKDMTLQLQHQDSLDKDVFQDTPDSGNPQSPNSAVGAWSPAAEQDGGAMCRRDEKNTEELSQELTQLEQQVTSLLEQPQQPEQRNSDHQDCISTIMQFADKLQQQIGDQLVLKLALLSAEAELEKEKEDNKKNIEVKDKELLEIEKKHQTKLAEVEEELKNEQAARKRDKHSYDTTIERLESEVDTLRHNMKRLESLQQKMDGIEGNPYRLDYRDTRVDDVDSDDADDRDAVSLAKMRVLVTQSTTSTPVSSRPKDSPMNSAQAQGSIRLAKNQDSNSAAHAPSMNPAPATEHQQSAVSEKTSKTLAESTESPKPAEAAGVCMSIESTEAQGAIGSIIALQGVEAALTSHTGTCIGQPVHESDQKITCPK